jgi:RNA polymerase sigma factor (sigma-70 family)
VATHHLYSEHADAIEAVLAYTRRANLLSADDGEEFSSWARLRLLEDDCAVLRKFEGKSKVKTFLVTVLQRLFLDWRNQEWGKWRPTAEARRIGRLAIELERLVLRDGIEYEQAAQLLVSRQVVGAVAECDAAWARLKRAGGRHFVTEDVLELVPAQASGGADPVEVEQRRLLAAKVVQALHEVLAQLPPADNLIFRLRYWDNISVANIARLQQIEQKPLYRRFDQVNAHIRQGLRARDIPDDQVRQLFDGLSIDLDDSGAGGGK